MRRIAIYTLLIIVGVLQGMAQHAVSQGNPEHVSLNNWKALVRALDTLGRDSTLADSPRARLIVISRAVKGLLEKMKTDSVKKAAMIKEDSAMIKEDSVLMKEDLVVIKRVHDSLAMMTAQKSGSPLAKQARDTVSARGVGVGSNSGMVRNLVIAGLFAISLLLFVLSGVGFWQKRKARRGIVAEMPMREEVQVPDRSEVKAGEVVVELKLDEPQESDLVAEPFRDLAFACEMMMTAGPRKKFMDQENADKDLGEDVCGCVIDGDRMELWLLDGTSDQYCLRNPLDGKEYFSSRLLAQCIGDRLREEFMGRRAGERLLDRIMEDAIEEVRMGWVRGFRGLPEEERDLLKDNIRRKNFPECASTLLAARLSLRGELSAYRSGDSKMLLFRDRGAAVAAGAKTIAGELIPLASSFTSKNPESNDRIFFRIVVDAAGELDILCNKPGFELLERDKVTGLIAFSDGIGAGTEQVLRDDYQEDPDDVRRQIVTHAQGTADDKSICFVRIREKV